MSDSILLPFPLKLRVVRPGSECITSAAPNKQGGQGEGGHPDIFPHSQEAGLPASSRHEPVYRGSYPAALGPAAWIQDMLWRLSWKLPEGWTGCQPQPSSCSRGVRARLSPAAPTALPRAVPNIWVYLDGKTQDLDPHATHVRSCYLPHQLGKLVPVLVDLLHCQGTCRGEEGEALYLEQVTHKNVGLSSATSLLSLISSGLGTRV